MNFYYEHRFFDFCSTIRQLRTLRQYDTPIYITYISTSTMQKVSAVTKTHKSTDSDIQGGSIDWLATCEHMCTHENQIETELRDTEISVQHVRSAASLVVFFPTSESLVTHHIFYVSIANISFERKPNASFSISIPFHPIKIVTIKYRPMELSDNIAHITSPFITFHFCVFFLCILFSSMI